MADFLTDDWFVGLNATLAAAGAAALAGAHPVRVVLEFADGPASLPHALTFTLTRDGATVNPGDHLAADALVRLTFSDARALVAGDVTSANALREGRVKVRGDLEAVVGLVEWLRRAHPRAES
ncbi:MAG: SCP2 sterol-binding domain-containing protein [Acidimicrobiales bacterium]